MVKPGQDKRRVQSIEVGFRVLRVLRTAEGPLPLREIAARAEMPPSKVHLYLVSFVREDMAFQDPDTGYYGLGSFAIQLGLAAIRQLDVVALAAEQLTALRDQTECAVYLSLWGDRGPCIVAKADGRLQGAFSIRLGYILPLTTSATGLVFLAHLPPSEAQSVIEAQLAVDAVSDSVSLAGDKLEERLEQVRREGFCSTVGQVNRHFAALAAPIFDYSHRIVATLTVLGPADNMGRKRQKEMRNMLLAATDTLSQRMGDAEMRDKAAE